MCLGKESKKKSKIKMRQCLGTNLNSLTWRFPTCVLFILYNAFFQSVDTKWKYQMKTKQNP